MANTTENLRLLTIHRLFNAPRRLLWQALTDTEFVKKWWGPEYFTAPFITIDLQDGGHYLYCMRSPDSKDYWSKGTYLQIDMPVKLIVADSFSDDKGSTVRASFYGLSDDFPLENIIVIEIKEYIGNLSKLTLRYSGIPAADFVNSRAGWNQSLDKLALSIEPVSVDWLSAVNSALKQNDIVT
jgi:uncharacterized protein YndB with AHSA1/START domain